MDSDTWVNTELLHEKLRCMEKRGLAIFNMTLHDTFRICSCLEPAEEWYLGAHAGYAVGGMYIMSERIIERTHFFLKHHHAMYAWHWMEF